LLIKRVIQKKFVKKIYNALYPKLSDIYERRDVKSVSEFYGQSMYVSNCYVFYCFKHWLADKLFFSMKSSAYKPQLDNVISHAHYYSYYLTAW
jgi:hypothetical protein